MNSSPYPIVTKTVPTFYFVGVTTKQSSIMKVFPRWMQALGRPDVVIEGIDHVPHDEPEAYRATVAQIKYDPLSLGALVTTHKIDLLEAARDMFDNLHSSAALTGEVSSISKRGDGLWGHAKDPITSGLSMDAFLGEGYFARTGGDFLCFGAGGSGKAMALHLINKTDPADRPKRFVVTNRSEGRLLGMKAMVESLETDIEFIYVHTSDPRVNDMVMGCHARWHGGGQRHRHGQGLARLSGHRQWAVPGEWHCLGDQLSRRAGFLAPGNGTAGRTQSIRRRWLAVLCPRLDSSHCRSPAYRSRPDYLR